MPAYYNEFDPKAAAWLRELIKRGLIADGDVDERDLWDVSPADIAQYAQVHLCAGIGVWSYSLRRADWPDDRPVWTGSFPCQPFSAAGKGGGFADERHLWPAGYHLISECRPPVVFGEQVASKDAEPWLDLVQADLEAVGYSLGAIPFPSAGVGAPHIRDRLYWVADAEHAERRPEREIDSNASGRHGSGRGRDAGGLADNHMQRQRPAGDAAWLGDVARVEQAVGLADMPGGGRREERQDAGRRDVGDRPQGLAAGSGTGGSDMRAGPVNGLWRDADWLFCRDGKWRPVEPGTFPLAHGAPARVGRLRGYGNAINAEAATAFIQSYLETQGA